MLTGAKPGPQVYRLLLETTNQVHRLAVDQPVVYVQGQLAGAGATGVERHRRQDRLASSVGRLVSDNRHDDGITHITGLCPGGVDQILVRWIDQVVSDPMHAALSSVGGERDTKPIGRGSV